jgi:hypothetical protein
MLIVSRWLGIGRWNFRISVERRPRLRRRRIRAFISRLAFALGVMIASVAQGAETNSPASAMGVPLVGATPSALKLEKELVLPPSSGSTKAPYCDPKGRCEVAPGMRLLCDQAQRDCIWNGTWDAAAGPVTQLSSPALTASSPDGTVSTAPGGSALYTISGTWAWGAAASGRPSEYAITLNGAANGGIAELMEVANSGMLYAQSADGTWWLWQSGGYIKTTAPPSPPPSSAMMTQGATWLAAHNMSNIPFAYFEQTSTIRKVNCTIQTPVGAAATFSVVKAPKGTPLSQGTTVTVISKPCDGNQPSGSNQDLTQGLIAVNADDTVGIVSTSPTWVTGAGVGQVAVGYTVP